MILRVQGSAGLRVGGGGGGVQGVRAAQQAAQARRSPRGPAAGAPLLLPAARRLPPASRNNELHLNLSAKPAALATAAGAVGGGGGGGGGGSVQSMLRCAACAALARWRARWAWLPPKRGSLLLLLSSLKTHARTAKGEQLLQQHIPPAVRPRTGWMGCRACLSWLHARQVRAQGRPARRAPQTNNHHSTRCVTALCV